MPLLFLSFSDRAQPWSALTRATLFCARRSPANATLALGSKNEDCRPAAEDKNQFNNGFRSETVASSMRRTRASPDRQVRANVANRQSHHHLSPAAVAVRINFHRAAQLPKSFPHTADSHSRRTCRQQFEFLFGRYASALILHFNSNLAAGMRHADGRSRALRMTMNVRKTFLHQPENRCLHISRQTFKIFRQFQLHLDSTAVRDSADVPAQSRRQPSLIEQRRVQQIGNSANIPGHVVYQHHAVRYGL